MPDSDFHFKEIIGAAGKDGFFRGRKEAMKAGGDWGVQGKGDGMALDSPGSWGAGEKWMGLGEGQKRWETEVWWGGGG